MGKRARTVVADFGSLEMGLMGLEPPFRLEIEPAACRRFVDIAQRVLPVSRVRMKIQRHRRTVASAAVAAQSISAELFELVSGWLEFLLRSRSTEAVLAWRQMLAFVVRVPARS